MIAYDTRAHTGAGARRIRRLPPLVAHQIAAGEVIERPASVLKELVENALDAGASRVEVEIDGGGIERIAVADDGCGIPAEDLPLALAAHATSKLADPEELERIATLGFRGEALASIASVARVRITSAVPGGEGATIAREGDAEEPVRPAARATGTTVEARTLFFNAPARRKFLRGASTERTRCLDWLREIALAHPGVAFAAVCDGKASLDLPAAAGPRERALAVLGAELEPELIEIGADRFDDARGLALWGLAGTPQIARSTARAQHVFLNGRVVRDRTIQHALREAYRGLIEPTRHPTAVLLLEMSPAAVDVNVHPAKLEVRFRDSSMVHQTVLRAVRDGLATAELTPRVSTRPDRPGSARPQFGPSDRPPQAWSRGPSSGSGEGRGLSEAALFAERVRRVRDEAWRAQGREPFPPVTAVEAALAADPGPQGTDDAGGHAGQPGASGGSRRGAAARVLQVHRAYLVAEDADGLLIVDQHALHERVLYERLLGRLARGARLESQRLLTPAIVEADGPQMEGLADAASLLERLGIELTPAGPASVAVHAFSSLLLARGVEPAAFVADVLSRLSSEGGPPAAESALEETLAMMACKAAVKAGDTLSESEIEALLSERGVTERASACPHGRPTSVRLTLAQLERLFHRR